MLWSGLSLVRSGRDTAIAQPNLTYTGTHSVTTMSPFPNTGPFRGDSRLCAARQLFLTQNLGG